MDRNKVFFKFNLILFLFKCFIAISIGLLKVLALAVRVKKIIL